MAELKRAVFLDRDGTLNEDRDYLSDPSELILIPGSLKALQSLDQRGFELILVTNQSGVGRGYFDMAAVERVHEHLAALLRAHGLAFRKIYVAPEAPDQPSRGRKPSPQFLFDARDEFGINLSNSFMVGDKWIDLECGRNAGVKASILVRTGYGRTVEQEKKSHLTPNTVIVDDFAAAARWILSNGNR